MTVEVRYLGHLGNNLFEYALGRILAEELGLAMSCVPASDMPGWSNVEKMSGIVDRLSNCYGQFADAPQTLAGKCIDEPQIRYVIGEKQGWTGQGINLDYLLRQGGDKNIVLHGYFQRTEYYHHYRERIRNWYRFKDSDTTIDLKPQDVVVHLRQSLDMFLLDRAIDLNFYTELLSGMSFSRVYVCGLGLNDQVHEALAPFQPIYLDLPAVDTLKLMTCANRIVLANSTFSWWGAYLSEASEIYYPRLVRNFWSKDRSDVDLEVPEERYVYINDVEVHTWRPFHSIPNVHIFVQAEDGEASRHILGYSGEVTGEVSIPAELVPFGIWLARRTSPFGIEDISELELPAAVRRACIQLLLVLCQRRVLHSNSVALKGIASFYGF